MARVYLDSCIVIHLVEGTGPLRRAIDSVLDAQPKGETWVSDLVRMECLVGPLQLGRRAVQERFESFFDTVAFVPLSREVFSLAAELRARHRLKTPDAIHLAAAVTGGCDEFWTSDARLERAPLQVAVRVIG